MAHYGWDSAGSSVDIGRQSRAAPATVNTSFGSIRRPSMAKLQMIDDKEPHVQTIVFNNDEEEVVMEQPTLLVKVTVCLLAAIAIAICLGMLFIKFD